jgi:glycine/D-amino acid oxidase-like deaminating enzyme
MRTTEKCDTLIIGGGVVGLANAYFLKTMAPAADVAVIECEPGYEHCSTLRASGGCRVQFSCPENIRMSISRSISSVASRI